MSEPIQEDHHPEIVENNKATRRLEILGVKEKLADPNTRREFFKSMSDERYKKMLGYINSLTRGKRIKYDYEDGRVPMDPTPPEEDKDHLMQQTFETVREILGNDTLDNEPALQVVGFSIY
ncbi:MAG: hypothetical protein WD988_04235 [Candidatus Curtissbacteria bacterium]